jgi:hypothetical protein
LQQAAPRQDMTSGRAQARPPSKRLARKTVPDPGGRFHPGCFARRNFPGNPAKLAAVPAGRRFFPRHGLDVGAVQRGCRPEAVEHDADRAAITARANNDPFPAGEIWASHRAERAHPDTGRWRQHGPLFGRLRRRSRRTESHCGIHLSFPFIVTIVLAPSPPCPCQQGNSGTRLTPRPSVRRRSAGPARAANRAACGPTRRSPVRSRPTARR